MEYLTTEDLINDLSKKLKRYFKLDGENFFKEYWKEPNQCSLFHFRVNSGNKLICIFVEVNKLDDKNYKVKFNGYDENFSIKQEKDLQDVIDSIQFVIKIQSNIVIKALKYLKNENNSLSTKQLEVSFNTFKKILNFMQSYNLISFDIYDENPINIKIASEGEKCLKYLNRSCN